MKLRIFLNLLIICFGALSWADETYLKYDEVQWTQNKPGYLDVIDTLDSLKANSGYEISWGEFRTFEFRESVYHISKLRKAKTTLVFIHGLYGGAHQFNSFFNSMDKNGSDANAVLLTLPGHYRQGNIDKPIKEATKEDWIEALQNTIRVAKSLSDRVVVIGQSTGGLLAVYSAINFPKIVDGVILLEPALKVHKRIDIATCLGKYFVKEASSLSFLAKLIGMDAPKGISVAMGCEVANFASQLLDRKLVEPSPYQDFQSMKEEPLEKAMSRLAEQIKIPVLLVNNLSDHVVDPSYNKVFANSLAKKMYLEINSDGKTQHGSMATLKTEYQNNSFYQYACDFLVQNFGERNCAKVYFEEKMKPYIYPYYVGQSGKEIKESFEKIKDDHVSQAICKVFEKNYSNPQLCSQFKEMIQMHIEFWQGVWRSYQANPDGFKSFDTFVTAYRKRYSDDDRAKVKKLVDTADYFRGLLEGTEFYDLGYIYREKYSEFQRRLEFVTSLEKNKTELESDCALLKKNFSNENKRDEVARVLYGKIPGVMFSDIHDTLRLIEKSHQIDEEIVAQRAYLETLKNYLQRVYAAKNQQLPDPAELYYIMKNNHQLKDNSYFRYGFEIQKIRVVISYLLRNNSNIAPL